MEIAKIHLAVALVNFNLGIEAVQLAIVLFSSAITYLYNLKSSRRIVQMGSLIIFILGAIWLVERIFS
ncbi:hypothetical protein [Bacillus sp. X1(2014)]|uniref:hypothetical protein n=1 Tax=Bacillus sp. X1(2014) TaxID=1565991 RepID=UPI0011AAA3EE|nr:hypothetical protein [Bacillus sp. X1(2014)]